jgi:hypothetical protein
MSTIVISAGRNIGNMPMSNGQWQGMREQLGDALRVVNAEVFTRDAIGNGEWLDGLGRTISEESVTYVASIDDTQLPVMQNLLRGIARQHMQEAIALMVGNSILVKGE